MKPNLLALIIASLSISTAWAETLNDDTPIEITESVSVVGEQESWFEEARTTALKMDADDLETPYSQSVLNSTLLDDFKANTLEEGFGYVSGFSRSGTAANSFTIRGMAADLQNLQVDGLPGLVSRFGSPVTANIEQVEVLKGPASVLYGWMEPGGMVNIVTKKPQAEAHNSVDLTYQNFVNQNKGGYEGSVDSTGALTADGKVMYRLIAGGEHENSYRGLVDNNSRYLYPSIAFQLDNDTRLDLQLEYTKEERGADDGLAVLNHDINTAASIETWYQENGDFDNDEGHALSATLTHQFNQQLSSEVRWRSVWHEDERDLYENNAVVASDSSLRRRDRHQYNAREYHFVDARLNLDMGEQIKHHLVMGLNGGYEYRQYDQLAIDSRGANVSLYNPVKTGNVLTEDPGSFRQWDIYNAGIYLTDRIELTDQLSLLAGVRHDYQEGDYHLYYRDADTSADDHTDTRSTNYNAGVVYRLTPQWSLYSSYAQSFSPQAVATYDENNQQMDPEQGEQYESGVKFGSDDGRLNMNLAWFDIHKYNVVENNGDYNELVGEIRSRGLELNPQYQITNNLQMQAGYTWTEAEVSNSLNDDAEGNTPAFAPVHSAFMWSRYNYPTQVMGGTVGSSLGMKYESVRYTDEETSKRVRLPGYTVINAGFYYERNSARYALNVSNLTNEQYYTGGSADTKIYPGEPLKLSLSAQYEF
ncbi:TonB-dependent siderophore receptor [Parathalassolituus penaei]|uniref:TonB-dependent receptor n=1 Tax=Parathalassolituus penaei TaxID=2997323 RepID=A0A9X3EH57_9GAMM|nr:TonB-dependent receptor [Parathalassolituus penaei]MCY0967427.1 TonB-dependent receptor [Parathalassolituus penaei]